MASFSDILAQSLEAAKDMCPLQLLIGQAFGTRKGRSRTQYLFLGSPIRRDGTVLILFRYAVHNEFANRLRLTLI